MKQYDRRGSKIVKETLVREISTLWEDCYWEKKKK